MFLWSLCQHFSSIGLFFPPLFVIFAEPNLTKCLSSLSLSLTHTHTHTHTQTNKQTNKLTPCLFCLVSVSFSLCQYSSSIFVSVYLHLCFSPLAVSVSLSLCLYPLCCSVASLCVNIFSSLPLFSSSLHACFNLIKWSFENHPSVFSRSLSINFLLSLVCFFLFSCLSSRVYLLCLSQILYIFHSPSVCLSVSLLCVSISLFSVVTIQLLFCLSL